MKRGDGSCFKGWNGFRNWLMVCCVVLGYVEVVGICGRYMVWGGWSFFVLFSFKYGGICEIVWLLVVGFFIGGLKRMGMV